MHDPIVQLTANDFEDAMDFGNMVFSVHGPINFQTTLPKLYKPTDEHMGWNYAIKRQGKIRAMVGLYPMELNIGGAVLKGRGIGAVSVHPNDRGQGHMKRLMAFHLDKMKTEGCHFSWLAGQRQRYGYFGYEVCGRVLTFLVSKDNVRHTCRHDTDITIQPIKSSDDPRLEQIKMWHDDFAIHMTRPLGTLWDVLKSWQHDVFVAVNAGGDTVGYLCANVETGFVFELGGEENSIKSIIPAWVNYKNNDTVTFLASALPGPLVSELSRICDKHGLLSNGSWQIFDWPYVVDALLKLKRSLMSLPDGEFCLDIKNVGVLRLVVNGSEASCTLVDSPATFSCDALTAHRLLFGPLDPALYGDINFPLLHTWCPLPLYMPKQDEV